VDQQRVRVSVRVMHRVRVRVRVSVRVKIKVRVSSSILPYCWSAGLVRSLYFTPGPHLIPLNIINIVHFQSPAGPVFMPNRFHCIDFYVSCSMEVAGTLNAACKEIFSLSPGC